MVSFFRVGKTRLLSSRIQEVESTTILRGHSAALGLALFVPQACPTSQKVVQE